MTFQNRSLFQILTNFKQIFDKLRLKMLPRRRYQNTARNVSKGPVYHYQKHFFRIPVPGALMNGILRQVENPVFLSHFRVQNTLLAFQACQNLWHLKKKGHAAT